MFSVKFLFLKRCMQMNSKINFKKSIFADIKDNLDSRIFVFVSIFLTLATFGFTISHFSMGIDDFGMRYYLDFSPESYGNMIQQGRLLHVVLYYITGLIQVIPFLNNFLSAIIMAFSGIVFLSIFNVVGNFQLKNFQKLIFLGIYLSYPATAFKFIYDIDVIITAVCYLSVAVSIIYAFSFAESFKLKDLFLALLFIFISIGGYESFNAVYVCGVLLVLIILYIYQNFKISQIFKQGGICALLLTVSFITYYGLVKIVQLLTNNAAYQRYNIFKNINDIVSIIKTILTKMFNFRLFFTVEFTVCVVLFIIIMLYFTLIKKKPFVLLLGMAFGVFLVAINFIQGFMLYRCCQTYVILISGTALLLLVLFNNKKSLRIITSTLLVLMLLLQLRDINLWFYKDWANYQKNVYAIHNIATDLYAEFSVEEKPVCFVNRDYDSLLMSWDDELMQTEIGESPIVSSVAFLSDITSDATFQLFEMQEYDKLIHPTVEQAEKALTLSKDMPGYPKEGYIKEFDDIIVVNLGKSN